eukprot:437595-Amphidinium_carterae.3
MRLLTLGPLAACATMIQVIRTGLKHSKGPTQWPSNLSSGCRASTKTGKPALDGVCVSGSWSPQH